MLMPSKMQAGIAMVLAMAAWESAADKIYRSIMPDGRVVFSSRPPPDAVNSKSTVYSHDSDGVNFARPEEIDGVRQRNRERTRLLDERVAALNAAASEYNSARLARERGREPLPGERIGVVGPGTRLNDSYFARQRLLDERVSEASKRLERAQAEYQAVR